MDNDRQKVFDTAQKLAAKGQFDKAVAELQKILRVDPTDSRTLLHLADFQLQMQARPEAIETYGRVAALYEQQLSWKKALAVYKNILQIDPSQVYVHGRMADMAAKLKLPAEAITHLEALAQHYARAQNSDGLLAVFHQMVQIDPANVAAHIRLAELLSRLGRGEEAVPEFEAGCALLLAAGRTDEWSKVAERLLFHRPGDIALVRRLAAHYLDRGDPKRALPKIQVAYKAAAKDVETLNLLAAAFRALGQLPKTVSVLKEVARIHNDAGRIAERNETYQHLLEIAPADNEAREALRSSSRMVRRPASVPPPPPAPEAAPASAPPAQDGGGDEVMIVEDEEEVVFDLKPSVPPGPDESPSGAHPAPSGEPYHPPSVSQVPFVGGASARGVAVERGPAAESARLVGEAEIFLKYGLRPKAQAHLVRAGELEPYSVELHTRLRDIYAGMNDAEGLLRESVRLAELLESVDPQAALDEAVQVLEIDPGNAAARAVYDRLQGGGPGDAQGDAQEDAQGEAPEDAQDEQPLIDEGEVVLAEAPHEADFADETGRDFDAGLFAREAYGLEDFTERGPVIGDEAEEPAALEPVEADPEADEFANDTYSGVGGRTAQNSIATQRREIEEGLDEAEFFVTQGLYDDARETLRQLLDMHPNHPLVMERWEEVEGIARMQGGEDQEDSAFALAEKLAEEVESLLPVETEPESGQIDVETVFAQFKQEIGRQVSVEDCDTHYDLGIAYKEMGLFDDAIAEFKIATLNPARQCVGETMIGVCLEEKGDLATAIEHFKRGLQAPQRTEREELGLYFEIGAAYEFLGDLSEALYFYQKVAKRDPTFRDVLQRVERITVHVDGGARVSSAPAIEDIDRAFDDLLKD